MNNINAIIIDDEPMARHLLKGIIDDFCPNVTILDLCQNLAEGVKSIHKYNPDIVFLDIEMPGHSGLELLEFFATENVNFSIIFTTAYNQYAIKAFKMSAVDYILKPIDPESVITTIERYHSNQSKMINLAALKDNLSIQNQFKKLAIHTVNSIDFIEINNLCYIKADGAYSILTLKNGEKIVSSKNLKYFENILADQTNIIRCHKSFIVNINEITKFMKSNGGSLIINNTDEISISNEKLKDILDILKV